MKRKVFKGLLLQDYMDTKAGTEVYFTLVEPNTMSLVNEEEHIVQAIIFVGNEEYIAYNYSYDGIYVKALDATNVEATYFKDIMRLLFLQSKISLSGLINPNQFQTLESKIII